MSSDPGPTRVVAVSLDPASGAATRLPGTAGCTTVDGSSNGTRAPRAPPLAMGQGTPPRSDGRLTNLSQSHARWREGKHGGTTFSFTLNRNARLTLTFTQKNHKHPLGTFSITGGSSPHRLTFTIAK